ncbi:dihydroxyacetone kinase subunit DhaL [Suttonella ornithocola]|uniref:PTS-dependent dihydroxyacetone kinase, ADP-binding subunit dhaL n=1 Tax=Suttonella ornithocola TaxID=279832 RepID=A0A380N1H3_9GAMM|nr:dihydroxyacetone kinase subunit DhaL [Suttonella ornithocola]SUO97751.1 PTS-dependent dihydroxyacetone kinase, ADP-binding subunit dhaL [Suttonella ornithocola]
MNTQTLINWITRCRDTLEENKDYLTDLDREIGDGDHGVNMARGFKKAAEKLETLDPSKTSPANVLKTVGMTLLSSIGGASGPLYGTFFIKAAQVAGDKSDLEIADIAKIFRAGTDGLIARGKASGGDKTMVDVWLPVCAELEETQLDLAMALSSAAETAEQAMTATVPMQAKKGRASYLGERSIGHIDPGAASSYLIIQALSEVSNG